MQKVYFLTFLPVPKEKKLELFAVKETLYIACIYLTWYLCFKTGVQLNALQPTETLDLCLSWEEMDMNCLYIPAPQAIHTHLYKT